MSVWTCTETAVFAARDGEEADPYENKTETANAVSVFYISGDNQSNTG